MTEGYIAVVLPKLHDVDEALSQLMTEEDYELYLNQSGPVLKGRDDESNDDAQGTVSHCDTVMG